MTRDRLTRIKILQCFQLCEFYPRCIFRLSKKLNLFTFPIMVALTGAVVATVATAGAAGPAVLAGVQAGAGIGASIGTGTAVVAGSSAATGAIVAGTAAVSGAAGAIGGSVAAGTGVAAVAGAAGGAVSGATAGAAITSLSAGILTGPVGWIVLGTAEARSAGTYTFDCWKQILHDDSCAPSSGKTLIEIAMDPRIRLVTTMGYYDGELPQLIVQKCVGRAIPYRIRLFTVQSVGCACC